MLRKPETPNVADSVGCSNAPRSLKRQMNESQLHLKVAHYKNFALKYPES